jgi:hypothetical protein
MLYLSIALVLIFVLYLLDKHSAWKGAAKIAAALVGLLLLGGAGIYGWAKYEDWRAAKKREADVTACIKTITEGERRLATTRKQPANGMDDRTDHALHRALGPSPHVATTPRCHELALGAQLPIAEYSMRGESNPQCI